MFPYSNFFRIKSHLKQPRLLLFKPIRKPLLPFFLPDKILKFHEIELKRSEGKISRSNFIPEHFSLGRYAKRNPLAGGIRNLLKINKHGLRNLSPQIYTACVPLKRAKGCLEQKVESASVSKRVHLAARRARNPLLFHYITEYTVQLIQGLPFHLRVRFRRLNKVIGAQARLALLAINQGVVKVCNMP